MGTPFTTLTSAALLPPKSIVNFCSVAGNTVAAISTTDNAKQLLSGALTAGTLKPLLSLTGQGRLDVCWLRCTDLTSRTIRLLIVLDGVSVFDSTSAALTDNATAVIGVGGVSGKGNDSKYSVIPEPMPFNANVVVWVASSLSETDKLMLHFMYTTS